MSLFPAGALRLRRALLSILLLAASAVSIAEVRSSALPGVYDPDRARSNYMLHCQGCHGPEGEGNRRAEVPNMVGFVGNFLQVDGGREFLVQVPGSANAALPDSALAELLNWLLITMSEDEVPEAFLPFAADEVFRLRQAPEFDVIGRRATLIAAMRQRGYLQED